MPGHFTGDRPYDSTEISLIRARDGPESAILAKITVEFDGDRDRDGTETETDTGPGTETDTGAGRGRAAGDRGRGLAGARRHGRM